MHPIWFHPLQRIIKCVLEMLLETMRLVLLYIYISFVQNAHHPAAYLLDAIQGLLTNIPYWSPADIPLDSNIGIEGQEWYKKFRKELDNILRWREYSMIECPAVVLLVATTTEEPLDTVSCFHELSHPCHLPHPYNTGQYDPTAVQYHYLLLHDEYRARKAGERVCDPNTVFAAMKESFPPDHCSFVRINGQPQGSTQHLSQPNTWWDDVCQLKSPDREQVVLGGCLSSENFTHLRQFGHELTCRQVLKSMEKRIAVLMPVANTVQNRVKSLVKSWWRKPKDGTPESDNSKGTVYPHNSVVSQTRLLADTALIMRDFESASSMYRAAAHQFKGDRSYVHYAVASQGAALASMMMHSNGGNRNRDVDTYMLNAEEACAHARSEMFSQFSPSMSTKLLPAVPPFTLHISPIPPVPIPLATRLASQVALQHSDALAKQGFDLEAGAVLIRNASNEPNLTGGILLEKAAWHFLKGKSVRQFGFYCIMAAHTYRAVGLRLHTIRCYSLVLGLYERSMWLANKAHIHSILAYELSDMGKAQAAIVMFIRLLTDMCHVPHSPSEEADFVRTFLNLCAKYPAAAKAAAVVLAQGGKGRGVTDMVVAAADDGKDEVLVHTTTNHAGCSYNSSMSDEEVVFESFPLPCISDSELIVLDGSEGGEGVGRRRIATDLRTSPLQIGGEDDDYQMLRSTSSHESVAEITHIWDELLDELEVMTAAAENGKGGVKTTAVNELTQRRQRNPAKPNAIWRAMGEPLSLYVVLKNPLKIPLILQTVHLTVTLTLCNAPELVTLDDPTNSSSSTDELQCITAQALSQTQFDEVLQQWVNSRGGPTMRHEVTEQVTDTNDDKEGTVIVDIVDVSLPPISEASIRLRVCPLRKGLLKINGVRWRLYEPPRLDQQSPAASVVGHHSFKLKGPLLHDTSEHREMKRRASCKMLYSAVVGAMPCLICTLSGIDSTILQGEVVNARLRVQNVGPAPAGSLLLKSNMAWLSLDKVQSNIGGTTTTTSGVGHSSTDKSGIGNGFTDGVSFAVGGSGTLFEPPVGPLMPGEVLELPMRLRPSEGGKQILILLLRYKRWVPNNDSAANEPKFGGSTVEDEELKDLYCGDVGCIDRFERFSYTSAGLTVLPSLSASVSVLPSYATPGEYILGIEIANYRTNYSANIVAVENLRLYIPRVCAVSCGWRMEPLCTVDAITGGQTSHAEEAMCEWQERIMLHYRLIANSDLSTVRDGDQSLGGVPPPPHDWNLPIIYSDCHWDSMGAPQVVHGLEAACAQVPYLQLLCLEHAAAEFASEKEKYLQQAAAEDAASSNHQPMTIQALRRRNITSSAHEALKHVSVYTHTHTCILILLTFLPCAACHLKMDAVVLRNSSSSLTIHHYH